jgi:gliding motility-associated-like protein
MMLLMRTRVSLLSILAFAGIFHFSLIAQQETPYVMNGSAQQQSCNCYQLTPDQMFEAGSVWNKNKIDLKQSFNYIFNVFLGCNDRYGADGIVFVLQPISTSIGSYGKGIGFENISPSIGIPIDTWQNFDFNDPPYDHTGIYKNGDLVNGSPNTLAGPVPVLPNYGNIEDCQWHTFRIIWDAGTQILSAEIDEVPCIQTKVDLVRDIFAGNSQVFWGFTSATGGQSNVQKFCTSLNPGISAPNGIKACAPTQMSFDDNSTSFGTIINWWWDFGDGTTFSGQHPKPHVYPNPGFYTVKLNIEANDGCISDTLYRNFVIGSIPTAEFTTFPPVICANSEVMFSDSSTVKYGTINQWNWDFNNGAEQIQKSTTGLSKIFPEGMMQISLTTQTAEGCISAPYVKTMDITPKPATSISVKDACYGDPVPLSAANLTPNIPVRQWYWFTGDGKEDSTANVNHYYPEGGVYTAGVYALNYGGCSSDTATATVTIYQTNAKVGNDTVAAFGQPIQLHSSGGELYQWTPAIGLSDPTIADPVAILNGDIQYIVEAYTTFGCPTYDTIQIKAYKGPNIYVPNAFTPDNNGINDRFHAVAVGMRSIDYFEVFNRMGQRVYSSRSIGAGWDGNFNGNPQPVGTYVWMIQGQDYMGKTHSERGTVLLIR